MTRKLFCNWIILAPVGYRIKLEWTFFKFTASEDDCTHDYITIYDNSTEPAAIIETFCGNYIPQNVKSISNMLTIVHSSRQLNNNNNNNSFTISYEFVNASDCKSNIMLYVSFLAYQ